jgi:hypothetical protein
MWQTVASNKPHHIRAFLRDFPDQGPNSLEQMMSAKITFFYCLQSDLIIVLLVTQAVLRKKKIDCSLAKRVLKVIGALRSSSLTELLEEETVEKLAELYDALFMAEKQNSATLTVLKGILYCVEDLSDTKEGK